MTILSTYLKGMSDIRRTGSAVKETSYYGTLENLFNQVGKALKPMVRCVIILKNCVGKPRRRVFYTEPVQKNSHELIKCQKSLRGVPLELDEITDVTNMIRRISAIILLEDELNVSYQKLKKYFYKQ
jgi:hypothetical protein